MPRPISKTVNQDDCDILHAAFKIYREELRELVTAQDPSAAINSELKLVEFLLPQFFEEPRNHGGHATLTLDDDVWAFIKDVGEKYVKAQRRRLIVAKAVEHISGSTSREEQRLNEFDGFLSELTQLNLPSKPALIKDFFGPVAGTAPAAEQRTLIQVQVGDIYGSNVAVAGINNGNITQGALPEDLGKLLAMLTDKIVNASDLNEEQRNDALGDVQTIQAQRTKAKPNKEIINTAVSSLGVLADAATVGQAAITFTPYIHHLAHLVSMLHF